MIYAKIAMGGEVFWIKVRRWNDSVVSGVIDNELVCSDVHGMREGDLVIWPRAEVLEYA